jgi:hypothetical protein
MEGHRYQNEPEQDVLKQKTRLHARFKADQRLAPQRRHTLSGDGMPQAARLNANELFQRQCRAAETVSSNMLADDRSVLVLDQKAAGGRPA